MPSDPWDWTIAYPKGATCRSIMWADKEVALINPRGDFREDTEADLAVGIAHAGRMHMILIRIGAELERAGCLTDYTVADVKSVLASIAAMDAGTYQESDDGDN